MNYPMHKPSKISLRNRIRLFFTPMLERIDYEERMLVRYKVLDGVTYLIAMESV